MKRTFLIIFILTILALAPITSVNAAGLVVCAAPPNCTFDELLATANKTINFVVTIAASIGAMLFAYAGWLYMTAAGDSGKIGQANSVFKSVAIGFFIVLSGWLIIKLVLGGLDAKETFQKVLPDKK